MIMVETPVLFITFARPDYARQTWDGIKAAKPQTLYFYSNKGRQEKEGEMEKNDEIRSFMIHSAELSVGYLITKRKVLFWKKTVYRQRHFLASWIK